MPRQWSNGWISLLRIVPRIQTQNAAALATDFANYAAATYELVALLRPDCIQVDRKNFLIFHPGPLWPHRPHVICHMISAWTQKSIATNWHWKKCSQVYRHMSWPWKALPCAPWNICSYTSGTKPTNGQTYVASTNSNMELAVWCSVRTPCEKVIWPRYIRYIGAVWLHALGWFPLRPSSHCSPSTCKVVTLELKKISDQTRKMAGSD